MARNYKYVTNHKKDSANSTGGWNRIATFQHNHPRSGGSGWLDRVTINFLVDDIDGADSLRSSFPFGHFFALSHDAAVGTVDSESNQLSPLNLLDISGRNGGGGVCTLTAKRAIRSNTNDADEGDGQIHLWQKNTDLTVDDNVIMRYYIETYGRWVTCVDA